MSAPPLRRGALRPGWAVGLAGEAGALRPTTAVRVPVTLLAGPAAGAALARWAAERPPDERWAVVHDAAAPPPLAESPALAVAGFSGGCLCCVGSSAFPLFLGRLLRRGPWQRLMVALPAGAEVAAAVDALLRGPLAPALARVEVVERADPGRTWVEQRAWLERMHDPRRWRWLAPGAPRAAWVWDQHTIFDRRRAEAMLTVLAAEPGVIALRAALRTAREWYAFEAGAQPAWRPEAERHASRIECAHVDPEVLDALGGRWSAAVHRAGAAPVVRIARSRNPEDDAPLPGDEGIG
jgi:hypothetical protein